MKLIKKTIRTPLGPMVAIASTETLVALEFTLPSRLKLLESRLKHWHGSPEVVSGESSVIDATKVWLDRYFAGESPELPDFLGAQGTPFELKVWSLLRKIPHGSTVSYGDLAKRIGKKNAARAIGGASRRNPISIITPCHRVVGSTGDLTGYGGGIEQKARLLQLEKALSALGYHLRQFDAPGSPGH